MPVYVKLCSNAVSLCSPLKHKANIIFFKGCFMTLLLILFSSFSGFAQTTITGIIRDKISRQPVPSVTVSFMEMKGAVVSNGEGQFKISTDKEIRGLRFSAVGYKPLHYRFTENTGHQLFIELEENSHQLEGVSIQAPKRPPYRNKNNPAVELIRKVIDNRDKNTARRDTNISFRQYEKLNLALNMATDKAHKSSLLRKFSFLLKTADTTKKSGRSLIPIFMQEKLSQFSQTMEHRNVKILDEKQSRIDQYLDEDGINEYLKRIYQHVDVYDHDIGLGSQKFLSPISSIAPEFYKYFIIDTLNQGSLKVVHLMFSPRSKQDMLFMGELFVPLDGHYAVQRVNLSVNKEINLNWVNDFQAEISYEQNAAGQYYIAKSVMAMDLGLFKGKASVFGEKTILTTDYQLRKKELILTDLHSLMPKSPLDTFKRPMQLSAMEKNAYNNIDSLKNSPKFKRMMGLGALVISGYLKEGPIDIGPVTSFYSFNHIEGKRFRIGGRTNEDFSDKVLLEGHVAYGMRDKTWKYAMAAAYSFKPSGLFRFPVSTFTLRHSYETQIPGQDLAFLEEDNFLLSFKRGINDKWMYNRKWSAEYFQETKDHLSFRIGYRNQELDPTGGLVFQPAAGGDPVKSLQLSEFTSEIRWAPHEQFYQGKRFRRPIKNPYPIFTLRASAGFKNFLGGDYNYQNISMNIYKRLYLSPFGYSDITLEGGMVLGKVPFPLLNIHRANQTYAYQLQAYNLMNFMEFMSDKYASANIDHAFNGIFLNKIPLLKKLQLREVASFKILYGGISSKNLPENNPDAYRFATDKQGIQSSFPLGKTPYMEGSIGISNIFKILRVDYVRRFNYLDNPHVAKWGIRARIHVDF